MSLPQFRSCIVRLIVLMVKLFGLLICGGTLVVIGALFWWAGVECRPGATPKPYPHTTPTEQVTTRNAVIWSQTRTLTYTTTVTLQQLSDHYAWEMQWTCQRSSIRPLTFVATFGQTDHYRASCFIKGSDDGGYHFEPNGIGYSFTTVQWVEIDVWVHTDGMLEVRHVEDFAEGC